MSATTEIREISSGIDKIVLYGAANVFLKPGEHPKIEISASSKSEADNLSITENGKTLSIKTKNKIIVQKGDNGSVQIIGGVSGGVIAIGYVGTVVSFDIPVIEITLPCVTEIEVNGSGEISYADICTDFVKARITGSGDIKLSGSVKSFDARISGSGDIRAYQLTTETAVLKVSGSGDIKANVTQNVKARVSGSGDIQIKGNPKIRNSKVSGSGDIDFI